MKDMHKIKLKCKCCGNEYEALVASTCSKSCGGTLREIGQKAKGEGKYSKNNGWMDGFEIKKNK